MSKKSLFRAAPLSTKEDKDKTVTSLIDTPHIKRVNFDLPADQHAKLKVYAAKQGKTMREVLAEFVAKLPSK